MASQVSTGSPKMGRKYMPPAHHSDEIDDPKPKRLERTTIKGSKSVTPVSIEATRHHNDFIQHDLERLNEPVHNINTILSQLHINDSRKPPAFQANHHNHLERAGLGINIKEAQNGLKAQPMATKDVPDSRSQKGADQFLGSELFTPSADDFAIEVNGVEKPNIQTTLEMARMRRELEAARSVINLQELELAESRNLRHTMEQAIGPASEADFPLGGEALAQPINITHAAFNASARPFTSRAEPNWSVARDSTSDFPTATFVNSNIRGGRAWNQNQGGLGNGSVSAYRGVTQPVNRAVRGSSFAYEVGCGPPTSPLQPNYLLDRTFSSGSSNASHALDGSLMSGVGSTANFIGSRRSGIQLRTNSNISEPLSPITSTGSYSSTLIDSAGLNGIGHMPYPNRGLNAQTSPIATQFQGGIGPMFSNDLPLPTHTLHDQSYVMPAEPMNYRRLLDKTVSCDWKYIVDKIVCNNDQQASIFLQQKLKVGTAEQKYDIVESIVGQAYPLMINRFGNFLVQRCFEHGTPEQVIAIASAIHGNVIALSMDPFGCHVIQKAFDSVPEDHKADMVRELLRRIPDTVIHRYACHVWQKLFELRWSGEPPQIMVKVNEALKGMWHEVALGETGSLVVQNIFENCVEEEKRPAIEEVIANIDLIAHGQFGNWCIQHLCEHGSPPDKRRVIDHILQNSYNYSIDQFASKVVEKCLKIGGSEFMERYLGVITTARPDRPRIPLIDIAGDQYGNYLIQWILMNTHQHQREQVAIHIRKHMVSLRGSKFGSRVAMLCGNPTAAARLGSASAITSPYSAPTQQRVSSRYR